jgi:hypothetical protein
MFVEDFLGFLHQSAFAKLRIILVRFTSAILESLSFPVYVFEWVCVLLIFHDVSPMTPILLVGARTERLEAEQVGQLARERHQVVQFKDT